jgi:acetyl-CoA carboxylase carboxyl transferase subunit beta
MNWLTNMLRPGVKAAAKKRDAPDDLWITCPNTGELIYKPDLDATHWVTPGGFHLRIGPEKRLRQLFDDANWEAIPLPEVPRDPLRFRDDKKYVDRLKAAKAKTGRDDCMTIGVGDIEGAPATIIVQDFEYMGGSLGTGAGEGFVAAAREAVSRGTGLVCVTASGGARMQEGILSLMQMARATVAVQEVREAGLPYIVVLTDPTTGGVTASYAMLGDVHIAEPGALIGFAGPRVIEQTIRQKLPEGFQRSEYLLDKGMVDMVVDRRELKPTLGRLLGLMAGPRSSRRGGSGGARRKALG